MPARRRHRRKEDQEATLLLAPRTLVSSNEASALAAELLSTSRTRPVAVVTVPREASVSWIDVDRLQREIGELGDVVVLSTVEASWGLSRSLPEHTQVYGGAGRVYPVGTDWVDEPWLSPLRFAYGPQDTEVSTSRLISDALAMVRAAGLAETAPTDLRETDGVVAQLVAPSRALVRLADEALATVTAELTVADTTIDRILTPGQAVHGLFDTTTGRLDVRRRLIPAADAVAHYRRGDVVLARVASLADDVVTVLLHPELRAVVPRDRVTANPRDSLRSLFSVGEVVAARVAWVDDGVLRLRLDDVEDSEEVRPAPALLAGGPAWLTLAPLPDFVRLDDDEDRPATSAPDETIPAGADGAAGTGLVPVPEKTQRGAARTLSLTLDATRATVRRLETELSRIRERLDSESDRLRSAEQQREAAERRARELEEDRVRLHTDLTALRTMYRKAESRAQQLQKKARSARDETTVPDDSTAFLDPEQQLRHEVYLAWVRRIGAAEKAALPLGAFAVGPRFLESLETLEGVSRGKVVDVVVEVLTGLAKRSEGRDVHRLRSGPSGSSPPRTREDGAACWRVALQRETASARRLHYWQLPDGTIELSRVVAHDDVEP